MGEVVKGVVGVIGVIAAFVAMVVVYFAGQHQARLDHMGWSPVVTPPDLEGEYVVYTNYRDVFVLKFEKGKWEQATRFNKGEHVDFWIERPYWKMNSEAGHE